MTAPSLVPGSDTLFFVEDDLGQRFGRIWSERPSDATDRETTLRDLYSGQFADPVRVVAFNPAEGWSRDVSHEFAAELLRRADLDRIELTGALAEFVSSYTLPARQLSLRLV